MLLGTHQHNIDAKGRLIIPSEFRSDLGERFCMCKGLDGCLFLFPLDEWERFVTALKALPMTKENRDITRYFLAGAAVAETDKQGRIVIPQHLRDYAGLAGASYITGVSNRAEVWSAEKWEKSNNAIDNENIEQAFENIDFRF